MVTDVVKPCSNIHESLTSEKNHESDNHHANSSWIHIQKNITRSELFVFIFLFYKYFIKHKRILILSISIYSKIHFKIHYFTNNLFFKYLVMSSNLTILYYKSPFVKGYKKDFSLIILFFILKNTLYFLPELPIFHSDLFLHISKFFSA